jgi:hypothetical protein
MSYLPRLSFIFAGTIMSAYAQMMQKKAAMTKKATKQTPAQNLEHELLTDLGVPSPGAPQPTTFAFIIPLLLSLKLPGRKGLCCVIARPRQPIHLKTWKRSIPGNGTKSPSLMMMTGTPLVAL